jgi:hypothetical protein
MRNLKASKQRRLSFATPIGKILKKKAGLTNPFSGTVSLCESTEGLSNHTIFMPT